MILDYYENQFERLLERKAFSNDFNQFKKDAFLKFKKLGFPTRRWEDWRFTNLKNIRRKSFLVPTYKDISAIDSKFDSFYRKGFIPLVFHNGHFLQPTRTNFKNLAINFDANFTTLMKYNGLFPESEEQPFELLNSAFMDSKIEITKNKNFCLYPENIFDLLKRGDILDIGFEDLKINDLEIIESEGTPGDVMGCFANIEKLTTLTGFKPKFSLKKGLKQMINFYR